MATGLVKRKFRCMGSAVQEWLRSTAARALMLAALTMSIVLAAAFIVIYTPPKTGVEGEPMSDEQAMAQVVDAARQIVTTTRMDEANGSAVFLSCTSLHDPPYQAAVYLNFRLPETNSVKRIREIATTMVAHGWQQAPAMGEHFGLKLTRDGVTATFHENLDDENFGTVRMYGQCRNVGDHRNDDPAWTDITDQLG